MKQFLASVAVLAMGWLLRAWFFMVALGVIHAVWLPQVPTVGFSIALLLSLLYTVQGLLSGLGEGLIKLVQGDQT